MLIAISCHYPTMQFSLTYPYQGQSMHFHSPPLSPSQSHSFVLKFVARNIRICQSCRSSLRKEDGSITVLHMIFAFPDLKKGHFGMRQVDHGALHHMRPIHITVLK